MDPLPIGTIADPQFMTGQVLMIPPEVRRKHLAIFGTTAPGNRRFSETGSRGTLSAASASPSSIRTAHSSKTSSNTTSPDTA